ncbi:TrkA family potassium uptake protein [Vibrio splendidus]|uniref:potassium channel family protein n=1 Tax=Vibrio splendidus TaxID=29497 RepID=UPI0000670692|nr:TrkA family potassium uptake protein [Vibrio splendidus]EAP94509.1 KtrA [Vibrio splendidus 12B01]KPL97637.1 potassium transporter KtrA [Vibrio splendidus]PTO77784.1 TrkA family potassium uptake protein [Vibrio splendidus]PTP04738.1 TrkA family potassium uptake protein [Vibrio splendidus]PTP21533.1 TrkA family potassium uptake protein [Vibrio splendidus]
MSDKQYAVIGLGRFGLSVCKELQSSGAQVLAVDIDEERVKEAANFVSQAIVANCTSEETVKELRLDDYDMVMVSIGSDVNSSILTTLVVKESGAKAVWVKANDKFHGKILSKIGADHIIMPERDMGIRVARKMLDRRVLEFIDLGSGLAMTEIVIGSNFLGKKLGDLKLCKENGVEVLGFKRGPNLTKAPKLDVSLEIGDVVIIAGPKETLSRKLRNW